MIHSSRYNAPYTQFLYKDEAQSVEYALSEFPWNPEISESTQKIAYDLIAELRESEGSRAELEVFLQEFSLDTEEGLALMCLAEALLRIPDAEKRNQLIKDKVACANWLGSSSRKKDWVVRAAGFGLFLTQKTMDSVLSRIGEPFIRKAMLKAMQLMGRQFVMGRGIEEATLNAQVLQQKGYNISYDMLGEAARTAQTAEQYFQAYSNAIEYIGENTHSSHLGQKPGISVKLSALHPRYEYSQKEICVAELSDIVLQLAKKARMQNISFTIDAEEVHRLDLSADIFSALLQDKSLRDWTGLGLAVQAYQKRALPFIDYIFELSKNSHMALHVRLVKGAYWDSEIKHAQEQGYKEYPVFTRKANTDLNYLACAHKLFHYSDYLFPKFATHNAHSIAAILEMAKQRQFQSKFEFQRLHGMGERLYDVLANKIDTNVVNYSLYAPVGTHEDLLPYLVRRLLENGASTSFVNKVMDPKCRIDTLIEDPVHNAAQHVTRRHPSIPLPMDIYGDHRKNAQGIDINDALSIEPLIEGIKTKKTQITACPFIEGKKYKDSSIRGEIYNPAHKKHIVGDVFFAQSAHIDKAFNAAQKSFKTWSKESAQKRADILNAIADAYEYNRTELIKLCVEEAGKTVADSIADIREAVDFCRYYAQQGQKLFSSQGQVLPGPTGERNILRLEGRGVFVCISPWNFPIAIFTGQIVAALMAGNTVIAKPAEQTPLIAMRAVELMIAAGLPQGVLSLLPGDAQVGAKIIQHPAVSGVAFTGSNEAAWSINQDLAKKRGEIVPFIAETGGLNAMIVDSSALCEQVIDDVLLSAFGSAGQRCSALRVLCVQEDIASDVIDMLSGSMAELVIGNPLNLASDIGPVIDEQAYERLVAHKRALEGFGKLIYQCSLEHLERASLGYNAKKTPELNKPDLNKNGSIQSEQEKAHKLSYSKNKSSQSKEYIKEHKKEHIKGHFFAPCAYEIQDIGHLEKEVFGPILHVVRYKSEQVEDMIEQINNAGYGLTLGIHSRVDSTQHDIINKASIGNIYVNRSMTGAVVGVQPFGGRGLSGTGPKAGGPHYLARFAYEKHISINTAASGGNAELVSLEE